MSPTFKIGDTVICIDNTGAPKSYKIGQKYTVRKLTRDIMSGKYVIGTYETEGSMYEFRFKISTKERSGFAAFIERHSL
jgi:hypothetical protein